MPNKMRVAIYCRVAREDDEAITQQEKILRNYAMEHDYNNITVYTNNVYNGLNFNRPAFFQMEKDIQARLVGTVLVKDVS